MATELFFKTGARFVDNNGNALAGGKLNFYQAGTVTRQNTFSDAAGTVPNANPVILSAYGRVENPVYLGDSTSFSDYKLVVTQSDDVEVYTMDNIPAATPVISDQGFGPELIDWQQKTVADTPVTLSATDAGKGYVLDTSGGNILVNLPSAASVGSGKGFVFKKTSASNQGEVRRSGTETIDGATSIYLDAQWTETKISSDGANWYIDRKYTVFPLDKASVAASFDDLKQTAASGYEGVAAPAQQADMEAATNTSNRFVVPGFQHHHPAHVKAFARVNGAGAFFDASYRVSSITRVAAGNYQIFSTDILNASAVATGKLNITGNIEVIEVNIVTTTRFDVQVIRSGTGLVDGNFAIWIVGDA